MSERDIRAPTEREVDADEEIVFTLDVTNVGSTSGTVQTPTMVVRDLDTDTDVTSAVTSGSMSVSGQVITLQKILDLTRGHRYRVSVRYVKEGNLIENEFTIRCPVGR